MHSSTIFYVVIVASIALDGVRSISTLQVSSARRKTYLPGQSKSTARALQFTANTELKESDNSVVHTSIETLCGYSCILGGALAHLSLGTVYCWGNFISYTLPSLRFFDGKSHPGETPDAIYVLPFTLVAQAIAMPLGPLLCQKIGFSHTLLFGSWLAAAAVFLASYQTRLFPFILLYSLMFGTGAGLAYTAPMSAGWKWMPNSKGLVSGSILAGFGAGGFIFSLIGSKLVNPNGLNPVNRLFPSSVYAAFPHMLRTLALLYAVISLCGSQLVKDRPAPEVSDSTVQQSNIAVSKIVPSLMWGLTVKESLSTHQFWLMWLMIVSSATAGLNTASIYKQIASTSTALVGDDFQSMVGGIGALFNGVGRLFWGSVSDKIGFKSSFTALTILQSLLMFTYSRSINSKLIFSMHTCLLFFCLAGNLALMPSATQRLFGSRAGAVVYGVLYSAFAIASVIGGVMTKYMAVTFGYSLLFRVMAVMSLLATLLVQFLHPIKSHSESLV